MTPTPPGRPAVAGLIALLASAAPAAGGEILHKLFHHDKHCADKQRVVLPSREVEVVSEQPRVVVRDITPHREVASRVVRRSFDLGMVPLGTVYLPMSLPMAGFPAVAGTTREVEVERNPLEEQLLTVLRGERARAMLQTTMEIHNRAIQQVGGTGIGSRGTIDSASMQQFEQKLNQMATELKNMNDRLTAVERLLIYHDNLLTANRSATSPGAPTRPMLPPQPAAGQPDMPAPAAAPPTGAPPVMIPPQK